MNSGEPAPSGLARAAIAAWAFLAALWAGVNVWQVVSVVEVSTSGGLGAVSSGVSEDIVVIAGAGLLVAVILAFRRRTTALERRLRRTHLYLTLGYVALGIAGFIWLATGIGDSQIALVGGMWVFLLVWATLIPIQIFFAAAAVTLAVDGYVKRDR